VGWVYKNNESKIHNLKKMMPSVGDKFIDNYGYENYITRIEGNIVYFEIPGSNVLRAASVSNSTSKRTCNGEVDAVSAKRPRH
jgi:hypothetical protein